MTPLLRPHEVGATPESFPLFRCPDCGLVGLIDREQFHGWASIVCGCGYHETRDWSARAPSDAAGGSRGAG